jgi:hypothetical protein
MMHIKETKKSFTNVRPKCPGPIPIPALTNGQYIINEANLLSYERPGAQSQALKNMGDAAGWSSEEIGPGVDRVLSTYRSFSRPPLGAVEFIKNDDRPT